MSLLRVREWLLLLLFLLLSTSLADDLTNEVDRFSQKVISSLNLSPHSSLSVSLLEKDKNYMLDLSPVFELVRESFAQKLSGSKVVFTSVEGTSASLVYDLITSNSTSKPLAIKELDTLFLSGEYTLESDSVLFCTIQLSSISSRVLASSTFTFEKRSAPAAIRAKLFSPLSKRRTKEQILYRGRVIDAVEGMVSSQQGNLLYTPAHFRLIKDNPYANLKQIDLFREVLSFRFGVLFKERANATIHIGYDGQILFKREGKVATIADCIDGEALLPDNFDRDLQQLDYPVRDFKSGKTKYESRPFTKSNAYVRQKIRQIFEVSYPALFNPLNSTQLRSIFKNSGNSILVGKLVESDRQSGREIVEYSWSPASRWIDRLVRLEGQGRSFNVSTRVMKIFQDEYASDRYWAVIKQEWQTENYSEVVYEDRGFLIVNFDFDMQKAQVKQFQISYRLWFYDYRYFERETNRGRVAKLKNDLQTYFVNPQMGVDGLSQELKNEILSFIIRKADEVDKRLLLQ